MSEVFASGRVRVIVLAVALFAIVSNVAATKRKDSERGPSTAEERARVVRVAEALSHDPLNPGLQEERQWAVDWAMEVPDVTVTYCGGVLGPLAGLEYEYEPVLKDVNILAQARIAIEHPNRVVPEQDVRLAATEAVLSAYDAILTNQPSARSKELDEVRTIRNAGSLEAYIGQQRYNCGGKEDRVRFRTRQSR